MKRCWPGDRIRVVAALMALAILPGATAGCQRAPRPREQSSRVNVLLVVVDALRADRLGCYGYTRATSPALDELARAGVVFTDAMGQGTETAVAVPALLSGRRPGSAGMSLVERAGKVFAEIAPEAKPLAELLRQAGYETGAVSANPLVGAPLGVERGFDSFEHTSGNAWVISTGQEVTRKATGWLTKRVHQDRPFFLYVHYLEPHNQYRPASECCVFGRPGYTPQDDVRNAAMNAVPDSLNGGKVTAAALAAHGLSTADVTRLSDLYDGEVLCADRAIGELLGAMKQLGVYDRTLIIVTADHGEAFLEHGYLEHGDSLYQEMLHVPLLMKAPGRPAVGRRVDGVVEHVDIGPTVLDAVGLPPDEGMSGQSLYAWLIGEQAITDPIGLAQIQAKHMWALRDGPMKLIASPEGAELYDLSRDAGEKHDLASRKPAEIKRLKGLLDDLTATQTARPARTDKATKRDLDALRSLGYLR